MWPLPRLFSEEEANVGSWLKVWCRRDQAASLVTGLQGQWQGPVMPGDGHDHLARLAMLLALPVQLMSAQAGHEAVFLIMSVVAPPWDTELGREAPVPGVTWSYLPVI